MILIKNATLYNMAGINGDYYDILIEDGKIKAIGSFNSYELGGVQVILAKHRYALPGLIDAHCHVGLLETLGFEPGNDVNEVTSPITPELRAIDALKPQDVGFEEALKGGVTTVATGPGSANIIGGTYCVCKTHGKTIDDMVIIEEAGMKMALGENPKRVYGRKNQTPSTRMATAAILRESLQKAKLYMEKWDQYENELKNDPKAKKPEYNAKWHSLMRVFKGMNVKIHCHQTDDIVTAIRISEEFGLNSTLEHCTEGYMIADVIKKHNKQVVLGPTLTSKSKHEVRNLSFKSASVMKKHGVEFALMTDHPVVSLEHTLVQAGLYVREGLSKYEALKALTVTPAKMLGIFDRVGSIEVGKDADIVIYSGDPFDYDTVVDYVIINGEIVYKREGLK